jgi:hypothetical protein
LLILPAALLCACAANVRMLKDAGAERVPDYHWTAEAADGLAVTVHTVVVPNGPGSWVRDADWDEYILTVRNSTGSAVRIETMSLESPYLPAPQPSSLSLGQLEDRTRACLRRVRNATTLAGGAATTAAATAAVGWAGSVAGASVAAAPAVALFIDYPLERAVENHHLEHEDRSMIELALLERGLHLALELEAGRETLRSVFFPLTPGPVQLAVGYRSADEQRTLVVPLPALAQLHLQPNGTAR